MLAEIAIDPTKPLRPADEYLLSRLMADYAEYVRREHADDSKRQTQG